MGIRNLYNFFKIFALIEFAQNCYFREKLFTLAYKFNIKRRTPSSDQPKKITTSPTAVTLFLSR